ncbi:hypothetical protein [Crocosphaera chwakensis]|uniref:Uncharacterized protein n=1 Tax=Crocosphaera chwakensis CCY0110 TaxID=391612 RepID=A3IMN2_9CHRO|nr:hypothetical protein [Crocosphaera chwakensis]EAZ92135.1 hypothetical protein CY0110_24531 [Crocosphaera chwakensis CCY0110]
MQIVINIPDNLPTERVNQMIKELEEKLQAEADLIPTQAKSTRRVYAHLITVDNLDLPSRDKLYER